MLKTGLRWVFVLGVLLVIGPLLSYLMRGVRDQAGENQVTFLVNASPLSGLAMAALTFIVTAAVAVVGAWAFTLGTGLACAGLVVAWVTWGQGTVEGMLRSAAGGGPLLMFTIEGLIAVIAAALVVAVAVAVNLKRQPAEYSQRLNSAGVLFLHRGENARSEQTIFAAVACVLAAAAVSGNLAWLLSVNALKGQVLFAALVASIGAGFASTYVSTRFARLASPTLAVIGVAIAAAVVPIITKVIHGSGLIEAMYAGRLFAGARIGPIDWAAGALLGVPVGVSWAGAVLDARAVEQQHDTQAATV